MRRGHNHGASVGVIIVKRSLVAACMTDAKLRVGCWVSLASSRDFLLSYTSFFLFLISGGK